MIAHIVTAIIVDVVLALIVVVVVVVHFKVNLLGVAVCTDD